MSQRSSPGLLVAVYVVLVLLTVLDLTHVYVASFCWMLLVSKPPPPPPCLLSQRERRAQTVQRTLYMLRAPLGASLSLSAMELSQPRSFSHAQRAVLYLGAWPGAALSFSHVRAQHTVLDLGAWPGAQARRDSCVWLANKFCILPHARGDRLQISLAATTTDRHAIFDPPPYSNYHYRDFRVF